MPDREACATFSVEGEDHTLGNALRFVLNKSPHTALCGCSVPHPSEEVVNVRVQTTGALPAAQVHVHASPWSRQQRDSACCARRAVHAGAPG
jgi:DNA-directed RNA polymerase subunit L